MEWRGSWETFADLVDTFFLHHDPEGLKNHLLVAISSNHELEVFLPALCNNRHTCITESKYMSDDLEHMPETKEEVLETAPSLFQSLNFSPSKIKDSNLGLTTHRG